MQLTTNRLLIRWIQESDAPFILKLLNDPTYVAMIRDTGVRDEEAARNFIKEKYIKSYETNGFGLNLITLHTGEAIGIIGIINRGLDVPDIGFAVLREHSGKGYVQEASKTIINHSKDVLKLPKISAITTEDNKASTKVILNLGFKFIKILKLPDADKELNYFELNL